MPVIDLTGRRFGRLVVLSFHGKKGTNPYWACRCDCGAERVLSAGNLTMGRTKSCGCLNRQRTSERRRTHGESRWTGNTAEYRIWCHMRGRCLNPGDHKWTDYGGRGITVCERWNEFANFLADMGRRPSPRHQIDRIDNNKGYEPGNCRWATAKEQANNRRRPSPRLY